MFYDKNRVDYVDNLDYAESAEINWEVGQTVYVKRIILVGVELGNGAEEITVEVGDADGGGTATEIGTFTIPDAMAVDEVHFANIAERQTGPTTSSIDGSTVYTGGDGLVKVIPGQELRISSTGGTATTGQADVYVEYIPGGFNEEDFTGQELTFTPS